MKPVLIVLGILIIVLALREYSKRLEGFIVLPDNYEASGRRIDTNRARSDAERLFYSQRPQYNNQTIIPLNRDVQNTIYFTAYDPQSGRVLGILKMCNSEDFVSALLDAGFVNQELFGFSGWYGYHIYELSGVDRDTVRALLGRALLHMKSSVNRNYVSILARGEETASLVKEDMRFIMSVKDTTHRFSPDNLYTLIYYK